MQPGYTTVGRGFIVSTLGISAIAYGIFALASRRRRTTRIVVPLAGIAMGSAGTAIMVFYFTMIVVANPNMAWAALPGGDSVIRIEVSLGEPTPPSAPTPVGPDFHQYVAVPLTPGQPPVPAPNIETMPIRDVMHLTLESIMSGMNLATVPRNQWPSALTVTTDDQSVIMPTGQSVGQLPRGLQLAYQPSADLTDYTLVITDPVTGGSVEYNTLTGVVTDR
ncbi:MAG TPA: hypothetical protein VEX88_08455 [Glaciibacter sp.]|nr:hypothetical protein [Glaciibacter sp.]